MSLTAFLSDPKYIELRLTFREEFVRPKFNVKNEIKAHPLTTNYGLIGTAFDYIIRFVIQFHNSDKEVHGGPWVAEIAFKRLDKRFTGNEQSILRKRFARAKSSHSKYVSTGRFNKQFYADCLFLAKLDLYIRCGLIVQDIFIDNDSDINDLKNLYKTIKISDFQFNERCFLNPTFGKGSLMVDGADADIILDDTLIDIKVTKYLKLEREYLNQLIGYYILALIGGINNEHDGSQIKKIGIYFARHGILWTMPLSDFGTQEKFNSFKDWFTNYFDKIHQQQTEDSKTKIKILKKQMKEEKLEAAKKKK